MRAEAIKRVEKVKNEREILAVEYHPLLPSVTKTVRKHWEVMTSQNKALKRAFPFPSLVAYRRPQNLKEILVKAKVSSKRTSRRLKNGYGPCQEGCMNCWHSVKTSTHKNHNTGESWSINAPINCNTRNCIYCITCVKCPTWGPYGGETARRLRDRAAEHRGYITQGKLDKAVGRHFNQPGHSVADMRICGIERVLPRGDPAIRKIRESLWIDRYDCIANGANIRD